MVLNSFTKVHWNTTLVNFTIFINVFLFKLKLFT